MNITIYFSIKNKSAKEKVENNLQWYDTVLKKMNTYKGGKLEFKYQKDKELEKLGYGNSYRMMPQVADLEVIALKPSSNEKAVLKWFDDFQNYRDSDSVIISKDKMGIEFDVPDNEVEEFMYECERNSFNVRV